MTAKATKTTKSAKGTKGASSSAKPKPAAKSSSSKAASKRPAASAAGKTATKAAKAKKPATTKPAAKSAKATAARSSSSRTSAAKASTSAKASATKASTSAKASATKASTSAKQAAKPAPAPEVDPLEVVKPLMRVRQMREFSTKRVTRAELEAITEVARWSGSSRNEQPNRYIAIRNADTIREIAELGLPQTRGLPTATAAVVIVEPDEPERAISRSFDDGRAAERVMVAANLLGLGGGISRVRADVREPIDRLLGLPPNRSVRTIVALGHPTAEALAPKSAPGKARLPREDVVYEEGWPPNQ